MDLQPYNARMPPQNYQLKNPNFSRFGGRMYRTHTALQKYSSINADSLLVFNAHLQVCNTAAPMRPFSADRMSDSTYVHSLCQEICAI